MPKYLLKVQNNTDTVGPNPVQTLSELKGFVSLFGTGIGMLHTDMYVLEMSYLGPVARMWFADYIQRLCPAIMSVTELAADSNLERD